MAASMAPNATSCSILANVSVGANGQPTEAAMAYHSFKRYLSTYSKGSSRSLSYACCASRSSVYGANRHSIFSPSNDILSLKPTSFRGVLMRNGIVPSRMRKSCFLLHSTEQEQAQQVMPNRSTSKTEWSPYVLGRQAQQPLVFN